MFCSICHLQILQFAIVTSVLDRRKFFKQGEFGEDGTETHFLIQGSTPAYIKAVSSGARKSGIIHTLFINGVEIEPSKE